MGRTVKHQYDFQEDYDIWHRNFNIIMWILKIQLKRKLPKIKSFLNNRKLYTNIGSPMGSRHKTIFKFRSILFHFNRPNALQKKIKFPRTPIDSKELISILSAPKFFHKRSVFQKRRGKQTKRNLSCNSKAVNKVPVNLRKTVSSSNIKKMTQCGTRKLVLKRKREILKILNNGDIKDLKKLPAIGTKTAEKIILYRQFRGSIHKISELAQMPEFRKRWFQNFIAKNYLRFN
ncbi:hypothetical protein ABEB36_001553 [Hypothenemus hampei]|uniref:Uncharacterized protein n=1 Tax=Hypothenemus hampei TaxID=57062 RepID=A0ABD1FEY6_HYPHA